MFLIDGHLHWSASDLTAAAECEYATLRTLDYKLGWAERVDQVADPLMEHISRLGTRYEETLLAERKAAGSVVALEPLAPPYTAVKLEAAGGATLDVFAADPDVVDQAAFNDGEFFGYADFVERADDGWLVCDAKLARSAKPRALLQLGAYADQIQSMSLPLSSRVALLLGNGERVEFRVADVLPVFRERRDRLRSLLSTHRDIGLPVAWGDDRHVSCGKCGECAHAGPAARGTLEGRRLLGTRRARRCQAGGRPGTTGGGSCSGSGRHTRRAGAAPAAWPSAPAWRRRPASRRLRAPRSRHTRRTPRRWPQPRRPRRGRRRRRRAWRRRPRRGLPG